MPVSDLHCYFTVDGQIWSEKFGQISSHILIFCSVFRFQCALHGLTDTAIICGEVSWTSVDKHQQPDILGGSKMQAKSIKNHH